MQSQPTAANLGFVTVIHENGGYLGGYLVTNSWGRPLEFRLTTAVQPTRVQQILYGTTLKPYLYADLIGKTLLERTAVPAQLLVTDCEPLLDLRCHSSIPLAWLAAADDPLAARLEQVGATIHRTAAGALLCHPKFPADGPIIGRVLDQMDPAIDLSEPFSRIREALIEARKLGAITRAA